MSGHEPFFSIGVTTYKRRDLLRQTLLSLLGQSFTDFEVIVGNDDIDEALSANSLGIQDTRVRFVNNPRNIGELENMNSLLGMARGQYYTWQFDDDPVAPSFLQEAYSALLKFNFPLCVFTSYSLIYGTSIHRFRTNSSGEIKLFSGKDFLRGYLSGRLQAMGCCGIYKRDYLNRVGGVHRLTDGPMALYTENLLLIGVGLLPEVAYINAPLVSSRVHSNSWTCSSNDVESFKQAGRNLIRESMTILSRVELRSDFQDNMTSLLKFVLGSVIVRSICANRRWDRNEMRDYVSSIREEFELLRGSALHRCAELGLDAACKNIPRDIAKAKLKNAIPRECLKYLHFARSMILRYSNRAF